MLDIMKEKALEQSLSVGDGIAAAGATLSNGITVGLFCLAIGIAFSGIFR